MAQISDTNAIMTTAQALAMNVADQAAAVNAAAQGSAVNAAQHAGAQEHTMNGVLTSPSDDQRLGFNNRTIQISSCERFQVPMDDGTVEEMVDWNFVKGMIEARHEFSTVFEDPSCSDEEARAIMLQLLADYEQEKGGKPSGESELTKFYIEKNNH